MRRWALLCVLGTVGLACAGGENSAGDNFTFGGPGGDQGSAEGDPTVGVGDSTVGDGTVDGGQGDGNDGVDGVACSDADGDDYGEGCAAGLDCDDTDPEVNPGMGEACDGVDENCDGMIDNGCDCPEDGVSGACNSSTDLGAIEVGGSALGVVGTIPQDTTFDWYMVSFPTAARPGEGTPTLGFAINTGDAFAFDVVANECDAQGAPCTEGGTAGAAVGLTSWTFADTDPGCCTAPMDSLVPWPNPVYVRVYRTTMGASCDTYQLQATRP
jgi:Putative metal-binding motif